MKSMVIANAVLIARNTCILIVGVAMADARYNNIVVPASQLFINITQYADALTISQVP